MYLTTVDETGSCRLLIMIIINNAMNRGATCWLTIICYYIKYFKHHFLLIILFCFCCCFFVFLIKEETTGRWQARNTHITQTGSCRIFKRMVPVDYSYQLEKEVSGTFYFTCPVTALPVSYRRHLNLFTALSTSLPYQPRPVSVLSLSCQSS